MEGVKEGTLAVANSSDFKLVLTSVYGRCNSTHSLDGLTYFDVIVVVMTMTSRIAVNYCNNFFVCTGLDQA